MRPSRSLALTLALASACSPPTAVRGDVHTAVDGSTFAAESFVRFVVHNRSSRSIYLMTCGDHLSVGIERLDGVRWENAAAAGCPADRSSVPLELQPGATVKGSVVVPAPGLTRIVSLYGAGVERVLISSPSAPFVVE